MYHNLDVSHISTVSDEETQIHWHITIVNNIVKHHRAASR